MKSAYELAMERLEKDAPAQPLSEEQKFALAEIDSRFKAKVAEKEVFLKGEIAKAQIAGDALSVEQLEEQLRRELRRIEADREDAKDKVRSGKA
jgi:hypothetical protein